MRDPGWDQIFIPGGKGGIPPPKAGSRHSHLGSHVGLAGSRTYPACHFTWVPTIVESDTYSHFCYPHYLHHKGNIPFSYLDQLHF